MRLKIAGCQKTGNSLFSSLKMVKSLYNIVRNIAVPLKINYFRIIQARMPPLLAKRLSEHGR